MSWHHLPTAQRDLGKRERAVGPRHSHVLERAGGRERRCLKRDWWELARTGQTAPRGGSKNQEEKGRLIYIWKHLAGSRKWKAKRGSVGKMQTSQRPSDHRTGSLREPSKCQRLTRVFSEHFGERDHPSASTVCTESRRKLFQAKIKKICYWQSSLKDLLKVVLQKEDRECLAGHGERGMLFYKFSSIRIVKLKLN